MRISFLGAAGEVTGSCFSVDTGAARFLVDCGLFQGGREADVKNLEAFDFDLERLDFVVLTHAHLDHAGLLPRLAALGWRGPVYATGASVDLCRILLLDSAHIQEKEAEWENRRRHARGKRPRSQRAPLYTVAQAEASLRLLRAVQYDVTFAPAPGIRCRLRDAGHILGSAIAELTLETPQGVRTLVFSGDLGQPARPVVRDPTPIARADWLVVESTYGNRLHRPLPDTEDELVAVLTDTLQRRGGNVVIPAFAVGRTQELLFVFAELCRRGRLPAFEVFVDSPMATAATELTLRHADLLDEQTRALIGWQRAHPDSPRVHFVRELEDSIALNQRRGGAVIVSASGMCEAGRIKYHLLHNLPRPECSVIIAGFQAAGTLGRRLVDGAKQVRILSQPLAVRAQVHTIGGLSAHADQAALLGWLRHFRPAPRRAFVVHGEARTADGFAELVRSELRWTAVEVPHRGAHYDLD